MDRNLTGKVYTYIDNAGRMYLPSSLLGRLGMGPFVGLSRSDQWGSYVDIYRHRSTVPAELLHLVVDMPLEQRMVKVPDTLRTTSDIQSLCTVIGMGDHLEMWKRIEKDGSIKPVSIQL